MSLAFVDEIRRFPEYKPHDEKISLWAESYGGRYGPSFMHCKDFCRDLLTKDQMLILVLQFFKSRMQRSLAVRSLDQEHTICTLTP